ncbi:MAG: ECF transporter S component [Eubacteriales bacterium]|nr:ECF transporter S component [Eubacteriales bacterium]MDD3881424.1 ECF transporter S component [Eubacteriales bacterium]
MNKSKITTMQLTVVGLMAALVFVCTYFFKIYIPVGDSQTMIKSANIVCLLSGLLFGSWIGGLAAGLGSFIFDLLDPRFIAGAPFTLINFFLMGFVCGKIAETYKKDQPRLKRDIIAAIAGALTYFVCYMIYSVVKNVIAGMQFGVAVSSFIVGKAWASGVNVVTGCVFSVLLAAPLRSALKKSKLSDGVLK